MNFDEYAVALLDGLEGVPVQDQRKRAHAFVVVLLKEVYDRGYEDNTDDYAHPVLCSCMDCR